LFNLAQERRKAFEDESVRYRWLLYTWAMKARDVWQLFS